MNAEEVNPPMAASEAVSTASGSTRTLMTAYATMTAIVTSETGEFLVSLQNQLKTHAHDPANAEFLLNFLLLADRFSNHAA